MPPPKRNVAPLLEFELPSGGVLQLQTPEEVEQLQLSCDRFLAEYSFEKFNDKVALGALLVQQLALFRAQQKISGMVPDFDPNTGLPTGKYKVTALKPAEEKAAHETMIRAAKEMREIEQTLTIDKKTRDAGGQQSLQTYLTNLKRVANEMGIHITERVKLYEEFVMELSTKLRILDNADQEDRRHHNISEESVLQYCREMVEACHEFDKRFAKQKGRLWLGKI